MKKIIYLIALLPLAIGCGGNKQAGEITLEDSLQAVTSGQKVRIHDQDSSLQLFIEGYNAIQDNLDLIKEKEKIVSQVSKDAETRKSKEEQIVADIQSIYDALNQNKERLAKLQGKLNKTNKKNEAEKLEMQKFIDRLTSQLTAKEGEIADLKAQLEQLNVEMTNLKTTYNETVQESAVKTEKLNTAYYAFGTAKELIKNGVLAKDGGFIGLGKTEKIKADFNKSYFTKIDVSTTTSIPLSGKKAKIITTHPAGSYKIQGTNKKVESISITNAEDFWSVSKYLVIVID
jgi:predicted  nucleic acid-binding Zn-ribbon protein